MFSEISYRGKQRFDLLLDRNDQNSSFVYDFAMNSHWMSFIRNVIGYDDLNIQISVVYSRPGAEEQLWHSDGPHIGSVSNWTGLGFSRPYALCVFVPLIDLDREVGFTQFWPGTHKYSELIGFGPACPQLETNVDGLISCGDCLIYDYRLLHRGMPNCSLQTERPVLQLLYHTKEYVETRNYGKESLWA
eukprot:TRINITY_DN2473_c0_g1_i15.p1 TRINITY_DN2473_c0_g1~~TRINITY_DN2473_c0_g1_i15.p1  ORF type:complete len:189 (-),score=7.07 TRINITY_DN2473_c0_g1_i15:85-651(-)